MSAALKLPLFAVALALVFLLALAVGATVDPGDPAPSPHAPAEHSQ